MPKSSRQSEKRIQNRPGSQMMHTDARSPKYFTGQFVVGSNHRRVSAQQPRTFDIQQTYAQKLADKGKMVQLRQLIGKSNDMQQFGNQDITTDQQQFDELLIPEDQFSKEKQREVTSPNAYSDIEREPNKEKQKLELQ